MGSFEIAFLCFFVIIFVFGTIALSTAAKIVREDKRLSVYRFGRYIGDKGPGIVFLIPFIDKGNLKDVGMTDDGPGRQQVGVVGETLTAVFRDGRVLFSSGEWDAVSQQPIAAGRRVRVVRTILEVEEE